MTRILLLTAASVFVLAAGAAAGPASDLVKSFYTPPGFEPDPSHRGSFIDPAKTIFEQNDKLSKNGEEIGCIDFGLAVDAQDFDDGVLAKTLKLTEKVNGSSAEVVAKFSLFPGSCADNRREIRWFLKKVGNAWKIADIASVTGGWRLGEFDCSAAE